MFRVGDLIARVPIVQGGMGIGISLSGLAGAVAAEGGIGVISAAQIGYREPDWEKHPVEANLRALGDELEKARKIANGGILGMNIMVATRHYERYVKEAVKSGVDLIISGAGLPMDLPAYVEKSRTKIAPIVSSQKALAVICRRWEKRYERTPDMVVAEGPKAGGHLGFSLQDLMNHSILDFDKEIKKMVQFLKELEDTMGKKIPLIVAGGVYEKKDMDHYMELGAQGVQIGTRFVTTVECDASDAFKQAYINAKEEDIQILKSPVGMPGRGIYNPNIGLFNSPKGCYQCIEKCNPKEIPYCITRALIHGVKGEIDKGMVFCGSEGYRATKIECVKDVIEEFTLPSKFSFPYSQI